uniref:Uncharacterized protein n=1 Tax=Sphaerodactylus townsendi TaxID=933632 RepID=A0ACB8EF32_9SAUR
MDADDSDNDIFFKKFAKKLFPGSEGDAGPTDQKQTRDACVSTEDGVEQNKHVKMEVSWLGLRFLLTEDLSC